MEQRVCGFLGEKVWAVVGASANRDKFGYRIYRLLERYGYRVYPVNPRETEIDGLPCYASLADLPEKPGAVDVVVPPAVAAGTARECAGLGFKKVWFQPGVADAGVIAAAEAAGLEYIHKKCVMVESSKLYCLGRKVWAVVADGYGADAAGRRLADFLTAKGFAASLVTPGGQYAKLAELPARPEVVAVAASPRLAEATVKECGALGIGNVWLEAGFETEELIEAAVALRIAVVHHAAVAGEYDSVVACRGKSPVV